MATPPADFRRSLWQRVADAFFGYDFFVSYAHVDGRLYAERLTRALTRRGFDCFLDTASYAKGDDWKIVGAAALKRTSRLVLVGTAGALKSKPVLREVTLFTGAGKRVIPIDFGGSLAASGDEPAPLLALLHDSVLRLGEAAGALASGPTEAVVSELVATFHHMRQSEKRKHGLQAVAGVLLAALVATAGLAWKAWHEQQNASRQLAASEWLIARSFRGPAFGGAGESPVAAAHHLIRAGLASLAAGERAAARDAAFAADFAGAAVRLTLVTDGGVEGTLLHPDGTRLLTWSTRGTAQLWHIASGRPVGGTMVLPGKIKGARFSADGRRLLLWSGEGSAGLWRTEEGVAVAPPMKHPGELEGATLSGDGQRVITWGGGVVQTWRADDGTARQTLRDQKNTSQADLGRTSGPLRTWSQDASNRVATAEDGVPAERLLSHPKRVFGARFSGDGWHLLTWENPGDVRLWDLRTGQLVGAWFHPTTPDDVQFSADGKYFYVLSGGRVLLRDAASGDRVGESLAKETRIRKVVFNADGRRLVIWKADRSLQVWRTEDGQPAGPAVKPDGLVPNAAISADLNTLVTMGRGAELWRIQDGSLRGAIHHEGAVRGMKFSADGQQLLTWDSDGLTRCSWLRDGKPVGSPMKHEAAVRTAEFVGEGDEVMCASRDGTVRFWRSREPRLVGSPMLHDQALKGASFSPDDRHILTWTGDLISRPSIARLWNAKDGTPVGEVMRHDATVDGAIFGDRGDKVLTWSNPGHRAYLWSGRDGRAIGQPMKHQSAVMGAAFSPDHRLILTWSVDGSARLWSAETAEEVQPGRPLRHGDAISAAAFSADGSRVLTASYDHVARLWEVATRQAIGPDLKHENWVWGATFNPTSPQILTWSQDHTAKLWSRDGQLEFVLPHEASVKGAEFSPDGQRVLSWDWNGAKHLWSAANGAHLAGPIEHNGGIPMARFSGDGRRFVACSLDGIVTLHRGSDGLPVGPPLKTRSPLAGVSLGWTGTHVLTWGADGMTRLWGAAGGQCLIALVSPGEIKSAAFNRDETQLVTADGNGVGRLWSLAFDPTIPLEMRELEFQVRSATVLGADGELRQLSPTEWQAKRRALLEAEVALGKTIAAGHGGRSLTAVEFDARRRELEAMKGSRAGMHPKEGF